MTRRCKVFQFLLMLLLFAGAAGSAGAASAQNCEAYQGKRITLVVPYSPGGGFDAYARVFASVLEARSGASVRIRNLPGAGAMLGINAVVNAGANELILGLFSPIVLLNEKMFGRKAPDIGSLVMLGSLYTDSTVWATRNDNPVQFASPEPRIFALSSNSDFTRILLPGYALGWNVSLVRGYGGSSDVMFALLRGDIDFVYSTAVSLSNYSQSSGGMEAFLSLTEGPNLVFPDIPYLAGEGGVVEQLTRELPPEQQQQRLAIAALATEFGKTRRAITMSGNADTELTACMLGVVADTIFSDDLQQMAAAQNLLIAPQSAATLQAEMDKTGALIESNRDLLQGLVEKSQR